MPNHINSASRLYGLFSSLSGHADQTQVLESWTQIFSISASTPKRQAVEVARRLDAISRELGLVRVDMNKAAFSALLYESAIASLEEATSPLLLPATWNNVRQYLTPQNLLAIQFCSEILPDEESQVSEEDLTKIRTLVADLRNAGNSEGIPASLRSLLLHHVDLIERAIDEYPISGVKALREAAQAGLGELIEAKETVAEHRKSDEVAKLATVWKKMVDVADAAIKADKVAQIGRKAWELIESVLTSAP